MSSVAIEVDSVCYVAGSEVVLENVSFSVSRGELVTIIGPNGSGKTTLVRIMMGLLQASSGVVHRAADLRMGYVPQDFRLNNYLPVVVRSFLGSTVASGSIKVKEAVELTGIEKLLNLSLVGLSGGELRRVMIAKALLAGHDVLVLDEPASYFDLKQRDNFYSLLKSINKELRCAIVLISHDLLMIMRHTDKVLCISRSVCYSGVPDQMGDNPELIRLFGDNFRNIAIHGHQHS